jgi:class 3 adenylate cyclase
VLKRFLHGELVDQAFSDPFGVVIAPREVRATMLVSDLRGFTTMSEKLSPVEVLELLNEVQTELAAAVKHHGGVVDKFLGDGMLATFGALRECPDQCEAAVRCAVEIVKRVERLNRVRPGREVKVGVGLHTGLVVAGTLGHGDRMEFTVLGDAVNTASRLEGVTKELGVPIAVSGETAREVQMPMKPCGEVALRGRAQPVQVFTPVPRSSRATG